LAGVSGRRRWVALLALAASSCTPTVAVRPLTAPGWEGCGVAELQGTMRNVLCPGLDLRLLRAQGFSGAPGVDAIAKGMPGGDATQKEVFHAGDIAIPARVHPDYLIAAPRVDVLAVCRDSTPALERCRAAIVAIAQNGLPEGVTFPGTRLELLGRPLVVPPGCQLATERIVCPTTGFAVDWREQEWKDDADAAITASTRSFRARYANVDEERVPCTLVGHAGVGARYTVHMDAGDAYALACVVERSGVASLAQCQGPAPIAAPYPSPCDQVFGAPD
jgi:hypothetical protein